MCAEAALIRPAADDDLVAVGRLLDDFNRESDEPPPGQEQIPARLRDLPAAGDTAVLIAGEGPDGLAVLRFRPSLWSRGLECYLAELYVVPALRGEGRGRALLDAAIALARERGADYMDLGTSEDDVAARALYTSAGFTNREHPPDGPVMYVYERPL